MAQRRMKEEKKLHTMGQAKQHSGMSGCCRSSTLGRAGDGMPSGGQCHVAMRDGHRPSPCLRVFAAGLFFLFITLYEEFFMGAS